MTDEFEIKHYVAVGEDQVGKDTYTNLHECALVDGVWKLADRRASFKTDKQLRGRFSTGVIYDIPVKGDTFRTGQAKFNRIWPDHEERQAWVAKHKALQSVQQLDRQRQAVLNDDKTLSVLDKLAMQRAKIRTYDQRTAFDLIVLEALRKYS